MPFHSLQNGRRALVSPLLAVAICLGGSWSSMAAGADKEGSREMVHQLRVYEIFEKNKSAFHARFRDHAVRIMGRHNFHIVSMWESKSSGRTEFVYILQWPNEQAMKESWSRFMADQEWSEIKAKSASEHGQMVGEIEDRVLRTTDYSPQLQW